MPKVEKVITHRAIYSRGLRTRNPENKSDWSHERTKPADENDPVLIPKGATYYTWKLHGGSRHYSRTPPDRSQLTSLEYIITLYGI